MESDTRNWEEQGQQDLELVEEDIVIDNPLAELASELAISLMALESGRGVFCDGCTCQLRFHAGTENGDCEICGCLSVYISPIKPTTHMPMSDSKSSRVFGPDMRMQTRDPYERARDAREALRELTE